MVDQTKDRIQEVQSANHAKKYEADTEKIRGILEALDFSESEKIENADIILLNTCAIRENAENRVFGELGRLKKYKKNNPELILGVCGCMPQEEKVVETVEHTHGYYDINMDGDRCGISDIEAAYQDSCESDLNPWD